MTLKLFMKFCQWFVDYILKPRGYGREGKAAILVFDGHSSRWCYAGIMWLLVNNCWPFCEPAKASRWAQVGDNAANAMVRAGMSHFYSIWCNQYDGLRTFGRNDYNWCYVQTINRINERMKAELLANPLPLPPPPPTRREPLVQPPTLKPDGFELKVTDLVEIPSDMDEELRPDHNLVHWLDIKEKQAVEAMCSDLDTLAPAYCRTVPPVRERAVTTLANKYRQLDRTVCLLKPLLVLLHPFAHTHIEHIEHEDTHVTHTCHTQTLTSHTLSNHSYITQYKCAGNSITRSMAFTGMCVTLKDGQTVLYPGCPGWTQAINTLGLAANPDSNQLSVESPTPMRKTRSDKNRVTKNCKIDTVYVFKV